VSDVILFANTSKIAPNILNDVMYTTLGFQGNATTSDQTVVWCATMLTDMAKEQVAKGCLARKSFPNSDGRVSLKERNPAMFAIKKQKYKMALARYMGITSKHRNNALQNGTCPPDSLVEGIPAPDKPVKPVSDKYNVQLPVLYGTPWIINNVHLGYYLPAIDLKQLLPSLDELPDSFLQGKRVRQFAQGQLDIEGNDIGGFFVLSDVAAAVLYENAKNAAQYANNTKQVNPLRAPSLKYIDSGHRNVSLLFVSFY